MSRQTIRITPEQALAHAVALHNDGQYAAAERYCRGVLKVSQGTVPAYVALGAALTEQGKFHEALYIFNKADRARPNDAMILSNRGAVLTELGDLHDALLDCRRAVQIQKKSPITWNNLGNVYDRMGENTKALDAFDRALRLDPHHDVSYYNKGLSLRRLNRMSEALAVFNKAIEKNPQNWDAVYNRATIRLANGDLAGGFEDYEARFLTREHRKPLYGPFPQPRWKKGEDISDKTLLICAEQGAGDTIQFLRYVADAPVLAGRVLFMVHEPLRSLCEFLDVEVMTPGTDLPPFDVQVNAMSLPWIMGTTPENIPPPWTFFMARRPGFGIGLCWSGNFEHKNDAHRSIPLEMFRGVMVPGKRYVNLQHDIRLNDETSFAMSNIETVPLTDFRATAEAIAGLELVITVDTSVAHLAASLGVPTWILLPAYQTDWRWMLEREGSPWYPSARLFRQPKVGDWGSVIGRVRSELAQSMAAKAA